MKDPECTAVEPSNVLFRLTGPVRIERPPDVVHIGPTAVRTLLAVLLLERGKFVRRDQIIDYLWDVPPKSAGVNLRGYVWELRRQLAVVGAALADRLRTLRGHRGGYALMVDAGTVDVEICAMSADSGSALLRAGSSSAAIEHLERALAMCSGPVGQGCSGSTALVERFSSLDDLNLMVREKLAAAKMMQGKNAELLPELHDLVVAAPYRETSWELLMRASYLGGDIAGAVATWKRATSTLADEFGLEPSLEMSDLYRAMLRRDDNAVRLGR